MKESAVEGVLYDAVRNLNGKCLRLAPTQKGIPDRIVLLPGGRHYIVELKQEGKQPTKLQLWRHEELANIGHPVVVLRGAEEVRQWIKSL